MHLNQMTDIISRIDSIDENTNDDFIYDILDEVYLMLITECKKYIDTMIDKYTVKQPIAEQEIEEPKLNKKQSVKQTAPKSESAYDDTIGDTDEIQYEVSKAAPRNTVRTTTPKKSRRSQNTDDYTGLFD